MITLRPLKLFERFSYQNDQMKNCFKKENPHYLRRWVGGLGNNSENSDLFKWASEYLTQKPVFNRAVWQKNGIQFSKNEILTRVSITQARAWAQFRARAQS